MSECCQTDNGSVVSKDELDNDDDDWVLDENTGTYSPVIEGEDK